MPVKGLIGSGSGNFVAQSVPNKAGDMVYRGIDTEYKILDNIADQLGGNISARGTVSTLTEKAACASCLNVAIKPVERAAPSAPVATAGSRSDGHSVRVACAIAAPTWPSRVQSDARGAGLGDEFR
ncbi:deaminase domain-containing protein [Achromobacter xylosoxidans]|uniref:deaminase domain-containing protein n=1 Tax=Alcaligenes xylosoxydans xylosoxydans TaxID=85698 RepID=UPI000D69A3DE